METTEHREHSTAGGEIGWNEFVDRYARPLHAAVRRALTRVQRRADRELVEDLVQEVWCRLLEQGVRPHRFRGRAHREVAGYLGRVAASVVVDRTRAACAVKRGGEQRTLRIEGGAGDRRPLDRLPDPAPSPEHRTLRRERRRLLVDRCRRLAGSGGLGRRNARIAVLALVGGWTSREIAAAVGGLAPSSVDSVIHRIKRRLATGGRPLPRR